jgi:hypothetical protein
VHVHPVLPRIAEASQLQLPRPGPGGQPNESSQLAAFLLISPKRNPKSIPKSYTPQAQVRHRLVQGSCARSLADDHPFARDGLFLTRRIFSGRRYASAPPRAGFRARILNVGRADSVGRGLQAAEGTEGAVRIRTVSYRAPAHPPSASRQRVF